MAMADLAIQAFARWVRLALWVRLTLHAKLCLAEQRAREVSKLVGVLTRVRADALGDCLLHVPHRVNDRLCALRHRRDRLVHHLLPLGPGRVGGRVLEELRSETWVGVTVRVRGGKGRGSRALD